MGCQHENNLCSDDGINDSRIFIFICCFWDYRVISGYFLRET
jgi:hypothetical protein